MVVMRAKGAVSGESDLCMPLRQGPVRYLRKHFSCRGTHKCEAKARSELVMLAVWE